MAKTIFYSLAALVRKILFCHSKIKFISSRHRVISSIYPLCIKFGSLLINKRSVPKVKKRKRKTRYQIETKLKLDKRKAELANKIKIKNDEEKQF